MPYFTPDFLRFFQELAANNHKEWFDQNRTRYEKAVKAPFAAFISEMIAHIQAEEPGFHLEAKDAIFRINRDIRFSADKTPYKTQTSAILSPYGRKNKMHPGFYIQFSHDQIMLAGGAYMLDKPLLLAVRRHIAAHPQEFASIYKDKGFRRLYGQILGEKNKRIPDEFSGMVDKEPLIAHKQFYYAAELDAEVIFKPDLVELCMTYHRGGKALNDFLISGM